MRMMHEAVNEAVTATTGLEDRPGLRPTAVEVWVLERRLLKRFHWRGGGNMNLTCDRCFEVDDENANRVEVVLPYMRLDRTIFLDGLINFGLGKGGLKASRLLDF